jgi:phosphoglycolate phosphatase
LLLIFDWDGTLSDSTGMITQAMQMAAEDLGWQVPLDKEVHEIIGLGLPEAIARLFPLRGEVERQQIRDRYAFHFVALDQLRPSMLFPAVQETLEHLRAEGHQLAIATGKSRRGLDRILANLGMSSFFHATRCADETASKPHPLMLEQLLVEFSVPSEESVMVGDTEYDMAMARTISMPRIAVSYGAHHVDRLHPYEPELCMDRFDELLTWPRLV